jgi:hypothetical protein
MGFNLALKGLNQQGQNNVDDSENLYAPSIAKTFILLVFPGTRFPSAFPL